jgi:hypothetical protein
VVVADEATLFQALGFPGIGFSYVIPCYKNNTLYYKSSIGYHNFFGKGGTIGEQDPIDGRRKRCKPGEQWGIG